MRFRFLVIFGAIAIPLATLNFISPTPVSPFKGLDRQGSETGFISCTPPEPTPVPAPTSSSDEPSA